MHTRHRAAATALLLTAGLVVTGGTAQASGTHQEAAHHPKPLVVTVKTKAHALKVSSSQLRPGNTVFQVRNAGGTGLIQVLRLRPGYDLNQAFTDFAAAFPSDNSTPPDVDAVRRIDKNVVFYGGMETPRKAGKVNTWGVRIDHAGTYYVVNLDANALTSFTVKGHAQKRALPTADGWINAAPGPQGAGNVFKAGKHNPAAGWMSTTNTAHEPHFVVLMHVKKSTTRHQVAQFFQGGPGTFLKKGGTDTGVISPGHTFVWAYHVPQGKYLTACFWPSKADGMPHALMGMWLLTHLG